MTGSINSNEVNFRIQGIAIEDLLNGSQCRGGGGLEREASIYFPSY